MKHLERKYFRYRSEVVARWQALYPERAKVLANSEVMRLLFILLGAGVVALLCGVLAVNSVARVGLSDWRPPLFGAVALYSTWITMRVFWALSVERLRP